MHALSIPLYFSRFIVDIYIVGGGTLLGFFIAYFESGLSMPSCLARLSDVFMVAGTILLGFCAGLVVVGQFIYNPGVDEDECDSIITNAEEYEYINRYYDEFLSILSSEELSAERLLELRNCFSTETTPRGDVIMSYNTDAGSFWYWADNKNITYDMLNTVARKFAVEFNCAVLYRHNELDADIDADIDTDIDTDAVADQEDNQSRSLYTTIRDSLSRVFFSHFSADTKEEESAEESAEESETESAEESAEECATTPKSVFAKFKNYNIVVKPSQDENSVNQCVRDVVETNRFTYKGKLTEHVLPHTNDVVEQEEANNIKAIDFATFKKMMQSENMNNSKIKTS